MSFRGGKSGNRFTTSRDTVAQDVVARDFAQDADFYQDQPDPTQKPGKTANKGPKPKLDKTKPRPHVHQPEDEIKDAHHGDRKPAPEPFHKHEGQPRTERGDRGERSSKTSHNNGEKSTKSSNNTKSFDFSKFTPFIPDNECMICSSPITIYAGSTCDHMDDLCGECLLKLKLFAKQNTSSVTINPQTGEEEQHRATVIIKPEYLLQCDTNTNPADLAPTSPSPSLSSPQGSQSNAISSINTISDPTLDVDFVSQARTRDPVCLFCHVQITPLLLSRTPIKPATYQLLQLLTELNQTPPKSTKYTDLEAKITSLFETLHPPPDSTNANTKSPKIFNISKYVETTFLYNAHLDLYTLTADGMDFAETVENTSAITCQKCIQHHDNQRDYSKLRHLQVEFNGYPVTYQSTPLIVPQTTPISLNHTSKYSTVKLPSEDPEVPPPQPQQHATQCSITTLSYQHATFSSIRQLQHHVQNAHHLDLCTACTSISHDFISSHPLYSHKDLLLHGRQQKHSFCTLCRHQAYDNDELYVHLIDPGNKHYMCQLCTTTTSPNPSDLAPGQQPLKKETFKFFRNKAAFVLHQHQHHYVCTHEKCKQWVSGTDPSHVRNPQRIVAFNTPLELQQHQQNVHSEKKQAGQAKKIDITAMFLTGSHTSDSAALSSTTPLPGQARQKNVVGKNDKGEEFSLSADDILVYTRVVQLAGHNQSQSQQLLTRAQPNQSNQSRSTSVEIVAEPTNFQPLQQNRYRELFPSLGNNSSSSSSSSSSAHSDYSGSQSHSKTSVSDLFPTLGGGSKTSQGQPTTSTKKPKANSKTEAFPSLGSSKSSSSQSLPPSSAPVTTVVARPNVLAPPTLVTTASTQKKNNNLQAFINWDRVNANPSQQLRRPTKVHTHDYYDYELHQATTDSSVPVYAQQYYAPVGGNTHASFAEAMGSSKLLDDSKQANDRKKLTGDQSIDFPSFLGTTAPVAPPQVKQAVPKNNQNKNQNQQGGKQQKGKQGVQLTNAWGVSSTPAVTQTQTKPKDKGKNSANNNNNNNNNSQKTNSNNTGLAATSAAPPPTVKTQKAAQSADVKSYHEELTKMLSTYLPAIDAEIRTIMTTPANRGKKNPLVQEYLFGTNFTCEGPASTPATPTAFQSTLQLLTKHSPSYILPGFQTLEVLQHLFGTTLKPLLSDVHRKSIQLTLSQIAILAQSLCSDDAEPSIFNFHTFKQIVELAPNAIQLDIMAKSFATYHDRITGKGPTNLPVLPYYPELPTHPVAETKKLASELNTILTDANSPTMNKKLLNFITRYMDLPQRIYLYVYLQYYFAQFLFAPTILQRIIFDNLRILDAQQ